MKVLFDLNVLLDVFMDRDPWSTDSKAAVQLALDQKIAGCVSAISITTLYYICRRTVGRDQAMIVVGRCIAVFEVAPVNQAILLAAMANRDGDFEDHVQMVSGVAAGADAIVTRDAEGFKGSQLRLFSPKLLAAEYAEKP
jgi:predicted nucleic acid-binding protein